MVCVGVCCICIRMYCVAMEYAYTCMHPPLPLVPISPTSTPPHPPTPPHHTGLHRTPRPGSLDITGYETDTHTRGAAAAQGGEDIFSIGIPDVAPGKTIRQCITGAMQQLAAQQRGVLIAAGQHLSTMQQQALERAIGA